MEQLTQYFNVFTLSDGLMLSAVVALILSLFSFKRQRKQQQSQLLSMQSLQRDLRALANAAVGVGGRVLEIERQQRKRPVIVNNSREEPQQLSDSPVEFYSTSNQPYEQAIGMAQTGASIKDIVNVCGLSQSEAELVSMMHRLDKAS